MGTYVMEVTMEGDGGRGHGGKNRGLTVISAFRHNLTKPDQLTDENVLKAMVLGWCVEWVRM